MRRWQYVDDGKTDGDASAIVRARFRGHSLLEALVATAIFVLVAVALAGVWIMYARALAKSSEILAANAVARSVTEGLSANGWLWLKEQESASPTLTFLTPVEVERVVRGRKATLKYQVGYLLEFRSSSIIFGSLNDAFSPDICRITVSVRWWSPTGGEASAGADYNAETQYSSYVYRHAL